MTDAAGAAATPVHPAGRAAVPLRPGHVSVRTVDGAYVGALMVTDHTGLPLDFRYTDPVTPTRLQRVLYGGVLDRYLRCDVILQTLLAATDQQPTLLLVDDRRLLEAPGLPCPAVLVGASAAAPIGPPGTTHAQGGDWQLLQVAEGAAPVRVTLPEGLDPVRADEALAALTALGGTMDVLEPAGRIADALDLIAAGEVDAEPE